MVDITSDYIINYFNRLINISNIPSNKSLLDNYEKEEANREIDLLKTMQICPIEKHGSNETKNRIRKHLSGIETKQIKTLVNDDFYDADLMLAVSCITDAAITTPSPNSNMGLNSIEKIRHWIVNLRQIGEESVEGYAMVGSFKSATDLFVLKVEKESYEGISSINHEMIVGIYGTNRLRNTIPNFSYIYGGFKCAPPLIDPNTKKVISFCANE